MQEPEWEAEYAAAFEEWDAGEDAALWDATTADGLVATSSASPLTDP
jgi:hypothetical protein